MSLLKIPCHLGCAILELLGSGGVMAKKILRKFLLENNEKEQQFLFFILPRSQQSEVNRDYLVALRRRFGLIGKKRANFLCFLWV